MKMICRYREFCDDKSLPSVKDNQCIMSSIDKAKVLTYLRNSKEGFASTVVFNDEFTSKPAHQEFITYSDGEFGWSTQEIYHFEKYDIKLDDEFISKVLN